MVRTLVEPTDEELDRAIEKRRLVVRIAWVVLALAIVILGVALWLSLRRWNASVNRHAIDCGFPFMGRYESTHPDPAAQGFYACWLQAPNLRHAALAAWSVCVALFALACAGWLLARRAHNPRHYA